MAKDIESYRWDKEKEIRERYSQELEAPVNILVGEKSFPMVANVETIIGLQSAIIADPLRVEEFFSENFDIDTHNSESPLEPPLLNFRDAKGVLHSVTCSELKQLLRGVSLRKDQCWNKKVELQQIIRTAGSIDDVNKVEWMCENA